MGLIRWELFQLLGYLITGVYVIAGGRLHTSPRNLFLGLCLPYIVILVLVAIGQISRNYCYFEESSSTQKMRRDRFSAVGDKLFWIVVGIILSKLVDYFWHPK